jgi:hypothetical protein
VGREPEEGQRARKPLLDGGHQAPPDPAATHAGRNGDPLHLGAVHGVRRIARSEVGHPDDGAAGLGDENDAPAIVETGDQRPIRRGELAWLDGIDQAERHPRAHRLQVERCEERPEPFRLVRPNDLAAESRYAPSVEVVGPSPSSS